MLTTVFKVCAKLKPPGVLHPQNTCVATLITEKTRSHNPPGENDSGRHLPRRMIFHKHSCCLHKPLHPVSCAGPSVQPSVQRWSHLSPHKQDQKPCADSHTLVTPTQRSLSAPPSGVAAPLPTIPAGSHGFVHRVSRPCSPPQRVLPPLYLELRAGAAEPRLLARCTGAEQQPGR